MSSNYAAPTLNADAFSCPHCDAYAHQVWYRGTGLDNRNTARELTYLSASFCVRCGDYVLWMDDKMLYPGVSSAPMPVDDMPDDVREDYLEARSILNMSPRGASALLRLAVQKLMPHLGEDTGNLNTAIGGLVKKGLPTQVQQGLDGLRVIGNNAVHPGVMDLKDDLGTAGALFEALNMIVSIMISQPKAVAELYSRLPETARSGIAKRDGVDGAAE